MDRLSNFDGLSNAACIDILPDILRSDFTAGLNIFSRLYGTDYHGRMLAIFKDFYITSSNEIGLNVGILSRLAAVFVSEPGMETEYDSICEKIRNGIGLAPS